MKRAILLLSISLICITQAFADFQSNLVAIMKVCSKGYQTIQGSYQKQLGDGTKVYGCTMPLNNFSPMVLVDDRGLVSFVAQGWGDNPELDLNMMIMLPPDGFAFERHDSQSDKSVNVPQGCNRLIYFVSQKEKLVLSVYFYPDKHFTLGVVPIGSK